MENRSNLPDTPLLSSYAMLGALNVKMSVEDFLDFAQWAFTKVKPFCVASKYACTVEAGGICNLPVDFKYIKSVSTYEGTFQEWKTTQTIDDTTDEVTDEHKISTTDEFAGSHLDLSTPNTLVSGEYVDFEKIDKSSFRVTPELEGYTVYVVGSAPLLDQDGYPLLTMKQSMALSYQIAVLYAQKQMFGGCKGLDIAYLTQMASKTTAQARVPDYISDNEWNEILDVRTSFDRKTYNKDFKFRK